MGGSSKSTSSSSNETNQTDNRVAVEAGGIGIGANAQVTTTTTDFGVLDATRDVLIQTLETAGDIFSDTNERLSGIVESNTAVLAEQAESDAKEISELLIKLAGFFAVIAALMLFIVRKK